MRLVMQITKPNATIWNPTYTITEGDGPWPVFDHNGEQVGYVERLFLRAEEFSSTGQQTIACCKQTCKMAARL